MNYIDLVPNESALYFLAIVKPHQPPILALIGIIVKTTFKSIIGKRELVVKKLTKFFKWWAAFVDELNGSFWKLMIEGHKVTSSTKLKSTNYVN